MLDGSLNNTYYYKCIGWPCTGTPDRYLRELIIQRCIKYRISDGKYGGKTVSNPGDLHSRMGCKKHDGVRISPINLYAWLHKTFERKLLKNSCFHEFYARRKVRKVSRKGELFFTEQRKERHFAYDVPLPSELLTVRDIQIKGHTRPITEGAMPLPEHPRNHISPYADFSPHSTHSADVTGNQYTSVNIGVRILCMTS